MAFTRVYEAVEPARTQIDALPGAVVIEFGTPWCGHCIAAQPLLEAAFDRGSRLQHLKIEDGSGRPLGRSFRVKLWPTLIFLRNGAEVARLVRPTDADTLAEALNRLMADEPTGTGPT